MTTLAVVPGGLWKLEGVETLPRDAAGLMALTLRIGGSPGSAPYLTPRPPQFAGVRETPFAERSGMTPVEMNKMLGELVQWQAQHPELSFSFAVTVTVEGTVVDQATLASLNEWLRQKRVGIEFEK